MRWLRREEEGLEEDCKGRRGGEYGKGDDWEGMEEMNRWLEYKLSIYKYRQV